MIFSVLDESQKKKEGKKKRKMAGGQSINLGYT